MIRTEELLEIKDQLVSMKNEILAALEEKIKSRDISEQRDIGDIFDDADLEQLREFNLMLSSRERQKLKQMFLQKSYDLAIGVLLHQRHR